MVNTFYQPQRRILFSPFLSPESYNGKYQTLSGWILQKNKIKKLKSPSIINCILLIYFCCNFSFLFFFLVSFFSFSASMQTFSLTRVCWFGKWQWYSSHLSTFHAYFRMRGCPSMLEFFWFLYLSHVFFSFSCSIWLPVNHSHLAWV